MSASTIRPLHVEGHMRRLRPLYPCRGAELSISHLGLRIHCRCVGSAPLQMSYFDVVELVDIELDEGLRTVEALGG